jgi:hypothetical protein
MVILETWLRKVHENKDLKPLRDEWWVKDVLDFLNWVDVAGPAPIELRYEVSNLIENVPETGPFKQMRLDIFRRLLYLRDTIK